MVAYVEHDIPGKSALTKLQVRHAVSNKEATAIGAALDNLDKVTKAKTELIAFLPALNEVLATIKKFKTTYKDKHPKFIKALDDDFGQPAQELLKKIENVRTAPSGVKQWSAAAEAKFMDAVKAVPPAFDAQNVPVLQKHLDEAVNLASAAANQAQLVITSLGQIEPFVTIMSEIQAVKNTQKQVDQILVKMREKNAYGVDPAPIKASLTACLSKTTHIGRLV